MPDIPSVDMSFSESNVKAYVEGNSQRTSVITFKADKLQTITFKLPKGVKLVNVTTGKTSAAGANVEISGSTKFYLTAPLNQAENVSATFSSKMKGSIDKEYSAYKITTGSGTQDLALVFGEGVGNEKYVDFKVTWTKECKVSIVKKDQDTGNALAGAVYGIYSDAAYTKLIAEMPATDQNGASQLTMEKTQEVVYLKEISVPTGYQIDTKSYNVTLAIGKTTTKNVTDKRVNAVDENGNKVEAEVVGDKSEDEASEENAEEEKKEKTIYYVTDEQQQSQYINMFKAAKMDAVILTHNIDQPFISQLEQKNEGIKFQRIDADVTDALKSKTSKKAEKEMEEQAESISKLMKKALKNDKITVKVEKLKNKKISSMITLSEESRRMQDMMKMYSMPGMDMSAFGGEGETLILNANHPLVQYITEHQDGENAEMICEQLYDLAKLQHAPLSADAMTKFVARSNDIMMLLTK